MCQEEPYNTRASCAAWSPNSGVSDQQHQPPKSWLCRRANPSSTEPCQLFHRAARRLLSRRSKRSRSNAVQSMKNLVVAKLRRTVTTTSASTGSFDWDYPAEALEPQEPHKR